MVSLADYIKAAKVVLRNQLLINLPLAPLYFGMVYNWAIRRHIARSGLALEPGVSALDSVAGAAWASRVPTAGGLVRDLVTCAIMEEAFFYVIHRALHWGPLYRHVHKFHHQFVAPMALSTTYAHPVEYVLSNLTGIVTAPATLGIHPYSIFVWVTFSLSSVIHAHSGYEIYGWPSARLHDWHHYSFNNAFGTYGLLDTWFGTMGGDRWFKYVDAYDRRQEEAEAEAAIENGN
ncbi:hypothetical protein BC828DRAFT_390706 [Blastocladiella britannica]|nr:hypothetical protein BC828DRAFT_390706 [Blastocladiella britannica]